MHLAPLIRDLALILGVAGIVTFLFRKIKQPIVLGYIVAGVLLGPYTTPFLVVTDIPNIHVLAELGVIFLMFSIGLEFSFHKLVRVGPTAIITAVIEVLGMFGVGYLFGKLAGWRTFDSLFLGGILSISSTTIIIKAFEELGLKTRRFAELVVGVLIVEDLAAVLLLVALSTMGEHGTASGMELIYAGLKLFFVVGGWFLFGYFLIPPLLKYAGRWMDNETLTVASTGLCLTLVAVASSLHYSSALGAFIMGSILSESTEAKRIEGLVKPLKDLFAAVFFVSVGMLVNPAVLVSEAKPLFLLVALVLFGKLFFCILGALLTGQPVRRSVQIGFSLAQIGEFSFIIATLGTALHVTSPFLYPLAVAISVITTFTTPYLIRFSEPCAAALEAWLPPRFRAFLAQYSHDWQRPKNTSAFASFLGRGALRFVLNGILVTVVYVAVGRSGISLLESRYPELTWLNLTGWTIATALAAPFAWGMFFAFRRSQREVRFTLRKTLGVVSFVHFSSRLTTLAWLGMLSDFFFPHLNVLWGLAIVAVLMIVLSLRRLESSYRWFEKRLLSNIKGDGADTDGTLRALAPWDLHLVKIPVHANSKIAGKNLRDANVRRQYGINIVVIQRGDRAIPSPSAMEHLFPGDDLLVLGSDEQIDQFRTQCERAPSGTFENVELSDFALRRLFLEPGSPCVGRRLIDAGIRDQLGGLVVGLEREQWRTINPDPQTVLARGDILWIARNTN